MQAMASDIWPKAIATQLLCLQRTAAHGKCGLTSLQQRCRHSLRRDSLGNSLTLLLATVLQAMVSDGRPLPDEAMELTSDGDNLTLITCWVNSWLGAQRMRRNMPGWYHVLSCQF